MSKKMTNLEYYINELLSYAGNSPYIDRAMQKAISKFVYNHRFEIKCEDTESFLNWLCKEHKEPIKLKQWEYDLIRNCEKADSYSENDSLSAYWIIEGMKKNGHFKGINDLRVRFKDILDNYIILSDDYEGFDDCK